MLPDNRRLKLPVSVDEYLLERERLFVLAALHADFDELRGRGIPAEIQFPST